MLKCRDVPKHAEQLVDGQLSFRARMSLRFHLMMCGHCRRYVRQLKLLLRLLPEAEAHRQAQAEEADVQAILAQLDRHRGQQG